MSRSPRLALVAALWSSVVLGGCDAAEPTAEARPIRVQVSAVGLDANELPVLLLEELGGGRRLPIWIGSSEARSIALEIEQRRSPRPNTHDLAEQVIDALEGEVVRVVVTEMRSSTYFATVTLRSSAGRIEIDSRPSDAVAIALRTGAPIFVRESLLSEASDPVGAGRPTPPSI